MRWSTRRKPSFSAMRFCSCSSSSSTNSMTLPVSTSIRWSWWVSDAASYRERPSPNSMPFENPRFLEQADRPVNGGDRDIRIDRRRARVERFDVRMVLAVAEHAGDHLALLGDAQTLVGAQCLDVDGTRHSSNVSLTPAIVQRKRVICGYDGASCRGRSTWRDCVSVRHNLARPSDSLAKVPTSDDIDPASCCSRSLDAFSAS